MVVALILAGGSGIRTEQEIPKQFFSVFEKPVILYTLSAFQKHSKIDAIIVSCLAGWQEILRVYAGQEGITKLKWIVSGGKNGQESARIALEALQGECCDEDLVVIHDAVRPLVSQEVISDCIESAEQFGSGLAAVRCQETIISTKDGIRGNVGIDRNDIMRVQTPQAYRYGKVLKSHQEALKRGICDAVYTNTLMLELGETLYFSKGSNKNIKITTMEDIDIFKAIYTIEQEDWVK